MIRLKFKEIQLNIGKDLLRVKSRTGIESIGYSPLDVEIPVGLVNLKNWYKASLLLYYRYNAKAVFRYPPIDFHIEMYAYENDYGYYHLKAFIEKQKQGCIVDIDRNHLRKFKDIIKDLDKIYVLDDVLIKKEGGETYINGELIPKDITDEIDKNYGKFIESRDKRHLFFMKNSEDGRFRVVATNSFIRFFKWEKKGYILFAQIRTSVDKVIYIHMGV